MLSEDFTKKLKTDFLSRAPQPVTLPDVFTILIVIVIGFDAGDVIVPIVAVAVITFAPDASVAVRLQLPELSAVVVPSSKALLYTLTVEPGVAVPVIV